MYTTKQQKKVAPRTLQHNCNKSICRHKVVQCNVWLNGQIIDYSSIVNDFNKKGQLLSKEQNLLLTQLINSESHYDFADLERILGFDKRIWKTTGSERPDIGNLSPKITEAGIPRMPVRVKSEELSEDGVKVKKNGAYCNITAGDKIKLEENETYLWVEKVNGDIILGKESQGLGHPTIALELESTQLANGTVGMARIGGEIKLKNGTIHMDNKSGRYGRNRVSANMRLPKEKIQNYFGVIVKSTFFG